MSDLEAGQVQWHCSEPDGGPDVGQYLSLGSGMYLWAGEITSFDWREAGPDAAELGEDFGFWLILRDGGVKTVLGKFVTIEAGEQLIEAIRVAISQVGHANDKKQNYKRRS